MHIENLYPSGRVDPSNALKGPWKAIEVRSLKAGETLDLQTSNAEYAVYILEGAGRLLDGQTPVELHSGVGVTLTKGSHVRLMADDHPLRFFMITFKL
jgi:quercetin dioxygenase-like cupin family protein